MINFDSNLCPPKSEKIFVDGIAPADFYIWDSWVLNSENDLKLFALASPKSFFQGSDVDIQTQRDWLPHHWRAFNSSDNGNTWTDEGAVFAPRLDNPSKFDSRSVWTGSVIKYKNDIIATYTGIRQKDDQHPFIQSIGLALWDDSKKCFVRHTNDALTCPLRDYDLIRSKGYYLDSKDDLGSVKGEEGRCAMAWRDASMVFDVQGQLHLLWSAKSSVEFEQEPVLAHGILQDPLCDPKLELLSPIRLPGSNNFTQAEVPQITYDAKSDKYYLMVSTTDRQSESQIDTELDTRVEMYQSSEINGNWQHLGSLIEKKDRRYPGLLISAQSNKLGGVDVVFTAPFNRSNAAEIMHTMPPLQKTNFLQR